MHKALPYIKTTLSLLFLFATFFLPTLLMQAAVWALFIVLSMISARRRNIFRFFFRYFFLILITLFVHLFLRFGQADYWSAFLSFPLWEKALYFASRNINILLIMSYIIKSGHSISLSNINQLIEGKRPASIMQPLLLALRYSALIRDEFRSLQQVHRIMGIRRPRRIMAKARYYISLVYPTIIASFERAEYLSLAMTSRGYNKDVK